MSRRKNTRSRKTREKQDYSANPKYSDSLGIDKINLTVESTADTG